MVQQLELVLLLELMLELLVLELVLVLVLETQRPCHLSHSPAHVLLPLARHPAAAPSRSPHPSLPL